MFDSHEEFNEWFSRDIESHAEKKSVMDEHQLSRLHLILKPFMLRRIKRDVEHEMAEKVCSPSKIFLFYATCSWVFVHSVEYFGCWLSVVPPRGVSAD